MVLSDRTIRQYIEEGRIKIDPYDPDELQPASVDLHFDKRVLVFRNNTAGYLDLHKDSVDLTEAVEIEPDVPFMLHPGEFVLGSTLEHIEIPNDLVARLEGKSSLGRDRPADPLHGGLRRPRLERPPDAGIDERVPNSHHAVLRHAHRPDFVSRTVHTGRPALWFPGFAEPISGPERSHHKPGAPRLRTASPK